jgi:hypothetical protein
VTLGAGLGVGLGVPLLLAFGAIALLWSRHRSQMVPELGTEEVRHASPDVVEDKVVHEVHSNSLSQTHELPAKEPPTTSP